MQLRGVGHKNYGVEYCIVLVDGVHVHVELGALCHVHLSIDSIP